MHPDARQTKLQDELVVCCAGHTGVSLPGKHGPAVAPKP